MRGRNGSTRRSHCGREPVEQKAEGRRERRKSERSRRLVRGWSARVPRSPLNHAQRLTCLLVSSKSQASSRRRREDAHNDGLLKHEEQKRLRAEVPECSFGSKVGTMRVALYKQCLDAGRPFARQRATDEQCLAQPILRHSSPSTPNPFFLHPQNAAASLSHLALVVPCILATRRPISGLRSECWPGKRGRRFPATVYCERVAVSTTRGLEEHARGIEAYVGQPRVGVPVLVRRVECVDPLYTQNERPQSAPHDARVEIVCGW